MLKILILNNFYICCICTDNFFLTMQCKHVNAMLIHVVASYWMSSADWPSCCEDVQSHVIHVLLSRDSTCRCSAAVPLLHCSNSLTHLNHEDMYVKEIDTGKKIYRWHWYIRHIIMILYTQMLVMWFDMFWVLFVDIMTFDQSMYLAIISDDKHITL